MGEHNDPWEWQLESGSDVKVNPKLFEDRNSFPADLPGLVEWLLEIQWSLGNLHDVDPCLPKLEYDKKFRELAGWRQSLMDSETQCWSELKRRCTNASNKDRQIALQALERRTGRDVPASQLETADLKKEIALQSSLNKLRVMIAVKKRRRPAVLGNRENVIRKAIGDDLSRLPYVRYLDSQELATPVSWQNKGCPESYILAYKIPHWKQKIHDEKHKARLRMKRQSGSPLSRSQ